MRIVFAGAPAFACPTLEALQAAGYPVIAVLTQPDRPAGRGRKLTPTPVKTLAVELGIPVHTPENGAFAERIVQEYHPDVVVVVAYGLILPASLLTIPRFGCLNIHASLLPRWRGAAPIARAIEAGDAQTGVTIMRLDAGLDTGPMLAHATTDIGPTDTALTLADRLARLGPETLLPVLNALHHGTSVPEVAQPAAGATYARKLRKEEGVIDWQREAIALDRQIRALTPWPEARTVIDGVATKICAARAVEIEREPAPGVVLQVKPDLLIGTGRGALCVTRLQAANGRAQATASFLQAHPLRPGDRIG